MAFQEPHQPKHFPFPKRPFGKNAAVQRTFQASWFDKFKWLHYDESADSVVCHLCSRAHHEGKLKSATKDSAFISSGFKNWKDATTGFRQHEGSKCHADAVLVMTVLPATTPDVGEVLSRAHAEEKAENRQAFLKILENVKFLCRQGLPFRGHNDAEGNFIQLLDLRKNDNS